MTASAIGNAYAPALVVDQFVSDDLAGNGMIRDIERGDLIGLPAGAPTQMPSLASVELSVLPKAGAASVMPAIKIPAAEFRSARLDLGEGYRLTVDERSQNLLLENSQHEARTLIWGDARIEGNTVSEPLQFWGTTSFAFGKESKITLETSKSPDDMNAYRLDKISVSTADRGMVITGLANDVAGDLKVTDFKYGSTVDDAARDGFTLTESIAKTYPEIAPKTSPVTSPETNHETAQTTSQKTEWLNDDDVAITQALLNATAVGGLFGPGSDVMSRAEFGALISRFFSSWALSSMVMQLRYTMNSEYNTRTNDHTSEDNKASERRLIERLIIEQALLQDMQVERAAALWA
jgi:Domain of Unknown Function (DUF1521)